MLDSYFWLAIRYSMNINPICDSSLKRSARLSSVTEIAAPQPFLCVNRSPIWYDFCGGGKAIQYSVNIASAYLWAYKIQKSCVCYILCSVSGLVLRHCLNFPSRHMYVVHHYRIHIFNKCPLVGYKIIRIPEARKYFLVACGIQVCFSIQRRTTSAGAFVCMFVGLKVLGLALGVELQDIK